MTEIHSDRIFNPEGNNFKNVSEKVRNGRLNPDSAWIELQPLLENYVPDYPEKFKGYQNLLREIFEIRREAYFFPEKRETASSEVRKKLSQASEEVQDLLTPPVVCIRDLFNLEAPRSKPRRF